MPVLQMETLRPAEAKSPGLGTQIWIKIGLACLPNPYCSHCTAFLLAQKG